VSARFVLLGHPLSHSLSPAIHHAAYRALGLSHRYELRDSPDEASVEAAFREIRSGAIACANVTVPWKQLAFSLADRVEATAGDVGAANTLVPDREGGLVAHNTDVGALAEELRGFVAGPFEALVLGAGGAALAAVAAVRSLGATRVSVSARRFGSDARTDWPNAGPLTRLGAELVEWPARGRTISLSGAPRVILQATSAGMAGAGEGSSVAEVVDFSAMAEGAVAYDLVYNPSDTPFLRAARAAGLAYRSGLGMLVGQAALAFELWLGRSAPRERMQQAAEAALAARNA
jgi:shikimate dehydrogenase